LNTAKERFVRSIEDHEHETAETPKWTSMNAWTYGTLANALMVSIPISGACVLQWKFGNGRNVLITDFFVSLAVSSMLGDAFFHVIPHLLGMHSHGGHDEHHEETHEEMNMTLKHNEEHQGHDHYEHDEEKEQEVLIKIGTIVFTMYAMWFISTLMKLSGKSHDHCNAYTKGVSDTCQLVKAEKEDVEEKKEVKWSKIGGVLLGDCMCNATDGLAMGVAWTKGFGLGLGTMMAIMMHEMPNVLGNYVVYKQLGLCSKRALGMVLIAAAVCMIGLFAGLTLAAIPDSERWLLGIIAGLFIHIPLVDIMPEMAIKPDCKNKYARFGTQNIGLILGFSIMIIIAKYEEAIAGFTAK